MIAQVIEAIKSCGKEFDRAENKSIGGMLESFKGIELKDYEEEVKECYQIRFV